MINCSGIKSSVTILLIFSGVSIAESQDQAAPDHTLAVSEYCYAPHPWELKWAAAKATVNAVPSDKVALSWFIFDRSNSNAVPVERYNEPQPAPFPISAAWYFPGSRRATFLVCSEGETESRTENVHSHCPQACPTPSLKPDPGLFIDDVTLVDEAGIPNELTLSYRLTCKHSSANVWVIYHGVYFDRAKVRRRINPTIVPKRHLEKGDVVSATGALVEFREGASNVRLTVHAWAPEHDAGHDYANLIVKAK